VRGCPSGIVAVIFYVDISPAAADDKPMLNAAKLAEVVEALQSLRVARIDYQDGEYAVTAYLVPPRVIRIDLKMSAP
jgi:hypothetical protein